MAAVGGYHRGAECRNAARSGGMFLGALVTARGRSSHVRAGGSIGQADSREAYRGERGRGTLGPVPTERELEIEFETWSSDRALRWCESLDEATAPRSVNWWLGVRSIAQLRVYDSRSPADTRLGWAAVAIALTDCAARYAGLNQWSAARDICNMRVFVISKLGAVPERDFWDIGTLIEFVVAKLTLDPGAARDLAQRWRTLPTDQILLLRQHKNLISPIRVLAARLPDTANGRTVQAWIDVHEVLP
jgi:hypothetical protein